MALFRFLISNLSACWPDHRHNTLSVTNRFLAARDTPELSVGVSAPGDVVDELPSLQGTAIDSDGVVRVEVLLRRVSASIGW